MRVRLFFISIIIIFYGCNRNSQKFDLIAKRDSIGVLIQQGQLTNDTLMLKKALSYCDYLIEADENHNNHFLYYKNKSIIFSVLGEKEKAWLEMEKSMQLLDENNIERLKFNCVKYLRLHNKDSIEYYFKKAFTVCENRLSTGWNENDVLSKTELLLYQGKRHEAKAYLKEESKKRPDNEVLKTALETWDEWSKTDHPFIGICNPDVNNGGYAIRK